MLLDERKTKRRVRIIAIITAFAFVGTIIPVIVLTLFQGGGTSAVEEALKVTRTEPKNPTAFEDLAAAYMAQDNVSRADQLKAIAASRTAVSLTPPAAPARLERVQLLSTYLVEAGQGDEAITVLNDFTKTHPKNSEGFLVLGQAADAQGKSQLARLAYQRYLALDPNGVSAADVQARLSALASEGTSTTPATPGTGTPATP